jgi:hypothetical protein
MKSVQMTVEGTADHHGGPLERVGAVRVRETIIIASTEGSVPVPDRQEKVGLNVYRKN